MKTSAVALMATMLLGACDVTKPSGNGSVVKNITGIGGSVTVFLRDCSNEMFVPPVNLTLHNEWITLEGRYAFGEVRQVKTFPRHLVTEIREIPGYGN